MPFLLSWAPLRRQKEGIFTVTAEKMDRLDGKALVELLRAPVHVEARSAAFRWNGYRAGECAWHTPELIKSGLKRVFLVTEFSRRAGEA